MDEYEALAKPLQYKPNIYIFYMKYSVNAGSILSFVKIVNFVRQATVKGQTCLMTVI